MDKAELTRQWRLKIGTRLTGIVVRPDDHWPGMWRIHASEDRVSDMVNLSRMRPSLGGARVALEATRVLAGTVGKWLREPPW